MKISVPDYPNIMLGGAICRVKSKFPFKKTSAIIVLLVFNLPVGSKNIIFVEVMSLKIASWYKLWAAELQGGFGNE